MPPITHVFVTVPPPAPGSERLVPIPTSEASAATGPLRCAPGKLYCLPYSSYTRRRLNAGDLELAKRDGKRAASPAEASAPASTKLEPDGSVAKDQRTDDEINQAAAVAAATKGKA